MSAPPIYQPGAPAPSVMRQQRDATAYGAGMARGLDELGQAGAHLAGVEHQLEREGQNFAYQRASAEAGAANDDYALKLRGELPAGAPGYAAKVLEHYDTTIEPTLPADPALRAQAMAQQAEVRRDVALRAEAYERTQSATKIAGDADVASSTRAASLFADPSLASLRIAREANRTMYASTQLLDGNQRELGTRQANAQAFEQGFDGLIMQGRTAEAAAWLSSPEAAELGDKLPQLGRTLRVEVDRRTAQANAAAKQEIELEKKSIAAAAAEADVGRAAPAVHYALAARLHAVGDDAGAINRTAKGDQIGAAEKWRGASPVERTAEIERLAAKPNLSAQEGAELDGLKGQAEYVQKLPALARAAYATGQAVAPIEWDKPASIGGRVAAWEAAQARFGGAPDFLLPGEDGPLRETIRGGDTAHKIGAMQTIMALPGKAARQVLDSVAGEDAGFRAAATLARFNDGGERMRLALAGPDALKSNKAIWQQQVDPKDGKTKLGPTHEELWASMAPALAGLPPSAVADIKANAMNMYAATAAREGWTDFKPDELYRTTRFALGGGKKNGVDAGGIGQWAGRQVMLPADMTQAEFDLAIGRAGPDKWMAAAGGRPAIMADPRGAGGRRVAATGELRSFAPVAVGDGIYELADGNARVQAKDGRPFRFDVRKLR